MGYFSGIYPGRFGMKHGVIWVSPKIRGVLLGRTPNKDHNILGSIVSGVPYFGGIHPHFWFDRV